MKKAFRWLRRIFELAGAIQILGSLGAATALGILTPAVLNAFIYLPFSLQIVLGISIFFMALAIILAIVKAMLERLSPKELENDPPVVPTSTPPQEESQEKEEPDLPDEPEAVPSEEALTSGPRGAQESLMEMLSAFDNKDIERGTEAYKQVQDAESNATERLRNEALYLFLRYRCGDTAAIDNLRDLAERVNETPEVRSHVYFLIGRCYEISDDPIRATEAYEVAVETAQSEEHRATYVVAAARCLFAAGNRDEAYSRVTGEIDESDGSQALFTLYNGLASLYEQADASELRAIALEKAIEYKPNDTQLRFYAAYSHSENDLYTLALMHYRRMLDFQPNNGSALNNVGVVYGKLQMPIEQVNSYRKAWEQGETLAAANLAYEYLNAGLVDEAMDLLNKAQQGEDVHSNVGSALAAVDRKKEAEAESITAALTTAGKQRRFLLSFADAYFSSRSEDPHYDGAWHFPDGVEANIVQNNNQLQIKWKRNDNEHSISATAKNRGMKITKYTRSKYSWLSSDDKGYAYLSQDDQQMNFMIVKAITPEYFTLKRN